MTRTVMIAAAPTPWDVEDRVVGNHSLPLTPEAHQAIASLVEGSLPEVTAVYRCKSNEACDEVAKLVAEKFQLKPSHSAGLDEVNVGLWQGLRREDLKFRFPKVVELWNKNPLAVEPPEGESIPVVAERLKGAVKSILKKNRGTTIAMALRPVAMQIVAGLLRGEPLESICTHLHSTSPMEIMDLSDEQIRAALG